MFSKVLVPLDGSDLSTKVLDYLGPALQQESTTVLTLCVKTEDADDAGAQALSELPSPATVQALERSGDPAEQILDVAKSEAVSLIAMSTHGRSGLSRLVRGSVAERVLRGAEAPLLLVNPHTFTAAKGAAIQRILVPLDGSARSAAIVPLVRELATLYGAQVTLFLVSMPETHESSAGLAREAEKERTLREQVAPHSEWLTEHGISVTVEVVSEFGPADQILQRVESLDADLVAMTTHGRGGLSRWLFGSVAEHVVRQCRAPLLVKRVSE